MSAGNYKCETENCEEPATAFGLKGNCKFRSCGQHVSALISQKLIVYSIEGYDFISWPQDSKLFDERKTAMEKGLKNLALQEASADLEYEAALRLLEAEKQTLLKAVEAQFEEIRAAVAKRLSELKAQFSSLRVNFNKYIQRQENTLLGSAQLLSEGRKIPASYIKLVIAGISESTASAIRKYWSVSSEDIESLFGVSAPVPPESATVETAKAIYKKGLEYYHSGQWREAEECYVLTKGIYEKCTPRSTEAAYNLENLGIVFTEMKRWTEAEQCYKQAQAIFDSIAPHSIEAARNHENYGVLCYYVDRLDEAEQHYQQAKRICETVGTQTTILAHALHGLGDLQRKAKRYREAEEFHRQAQRTFKMVAPQSLGAASNYTNLGLVCYELGRLKDAEDNYLLAKRIFETAHPKSVYFASCLHNLGLLYEAQCRNEESVVALQSAAELYASNQNSEMKSKAEICIARVQAKLNTQ